MKTKYVFLCFLTVGLSPLSYAYDYAQEVRDSCKGLNHFAQLGQHAYQTKNYTNALEHFQAQASWTHFCVINADITHQTISPSQLATTYNNVGLTHNKLQQPRWARAWFSLKPNDRKSQFNLNQLPPIPRSTNKVGTYVRYSSQGVWDTLIVSAHGDFYQIDYTGLNMRTNGMLAGPNLGEFSVQFAKSRNTAQYHYEDCTIDIKFDQGERVELKQNQVDCGFGLGVYAEGEYVKVETLKY